MFFNTNINFFNVIYALFLREIQTRFGSKKMGYFWAIAEPAAFIAAISSLKSFLLNRYIPGLDFAVFVTTSLILFFLFRNIVKGLMNAFESNKALFVYSPVRPIHTLLSRVLVEFLVSSLVLFLFLFLGWYFNFDILVNDLFMVLVCILWLKVFALSLGFLFSIIGFFYKSFKKFISILLTPLLFLSAVFYTVESLPIFARKIILYNPITHFMELLHGSYFRVLNTNYVDFLYMTYWTIIPFFIALFLYNKSERKIQAS